MYFKDVKDIRISSGSVNKITDSYGRVIWEKINNSGGVGISLLFDITNYQSNGLPYYWTWADSNNGVRLRNNYYFQWTVVTAASGGLATAGYRSTRVNVTSSNSSVVRIRTISYNAYDGEMDGKVFVFDALRKGTAVITGVYQRNTNLKRSQTINVL